MKVVIGIVLVFSLSVIPLSIGQQKTVRPQPGGALTGDPLEFTQRWAVVVGIGSYRDKAIPRLNFPEKDAQLMADTLVQESGFPADHVKVLIGSEAIKGKVEQAIRGWLVQQASPEDLAIVYFSGHGDFVTDRNYDEQDGVDEALLPYDARQGQAYSYIVDDDFNLWLSGVHAKRVVVVLDSCYSGEASKTAKAQSRNVERADATPKTGKRDGILEDLASERQVTLTASAGREQAYEFSELGHGVFTYYLAEALGGKADTDEDKRISLDEAFRYVLGHVTDYLEKHVPGVRQTPQISEYEAALVLADLSVAEGDLYVNSHPTGASITLDGQPTGKTTPHTFRDLPTGRHIVKLDHPQCESVEQEVYVPRGATANHQPTLPALPAQATQITGRVLDPDSNPLGGVRVLATGTRYQTATKPDGSFALSDIPADDYRLSFSQETLHFETRYELEKSGYELYRETVPVLEHLTVPVEVMLRQKSSGLAGPPHDPKQQRITSKDGAPMVRIPAGDFQMGDAFSEGDSDELPVHTVYLDAFYMDVYEVTNAQYAAFLNTYGRNTDDAGHELLDIGDSDCLIERVGNRYHPVVLRTNPLNPLPLAARGFSENTDG